MAAGPGGPDLAAHVASDQFSGENDPLADDVVESAPAPQGGQPDEVAPNAAPDQGVPAEGEPLYAGKYRSPEELEQAYRAAEAWGTQLSQQQRELSDRLAASEQFIAQQNQMYEQQLIAAAEQDPELAAELQRQMELRQQVDAQVAPIRDQMTRQQEMTQTMGVVNWFRDQHPDIVPNSPDDHELAQIVKDLDLEVANPESLEIAYESLRDPYFRKALAADLRRVDTDNGLAEARALARQMEQYQVPVGVLQPQQMQQIFGQNGGQQMQPNGQSQRQVPYVERGGTGAPISGAPGRRPTQGQGGDEFDAVLDLAKREKASPLFGGLLNRS